MIGLVLGRPRLRHTESDPFHCQEIIEILGKIPGDQAVVVDLLPRKFRDALSLGCYVTIFRRHWGQLVLLLTFTILKIIIGIIQRLLSQKLRAYIRRRPCSAAGCKGVVTVSSTVSDR